MRAVLIVVLVLSAACYCNAQSEPVAPDASTGNVVQGVPATLDREFSITPGTTGDQEQKRTFTLNKDFKYQAPYKILPGATTMQGPCYTMRAYLYSPGAPGTAPRRTGYTTCTPSSALQMRQTAPPKVRLLPQQ